MAKQPDRTAMPKPKPVEIILDMILNALSEAGGEQYLARQANENPSAFMTLLGKVLPTQVTGHEGGPVEMIVTGVRRCEDHEEAAPAPSS
jgi:hypothetical protein